VHSSVRVHKTERFYVSGHMRQLRQGGFHFVCLFVC